MDIGESVAFVQTLQSQGNCVICGQQHEEKRKTEDITETAPGNSGWHRKSMSGIFDTGNSKRTAIYPHGSFPPPYEYQGHHCIALSALVVKADKPSRKDRRIRLNYFLNKVDFYPNRPKNCIGLPARKSNGDYQAFWDSLDADAPLQMHGPAHDEEYFLQVDQLLVRMLVYLTSQDLCKEVDQQEWEDELKEVVAYAENFAFNKLSNNELAWRLHPAEQNLAVRIYKAPPREEFTVIGANKVTRTEMGKGKSSATIVFPDPQLETIF